LLLSNYNDMNYIMDLDVRDFMNLLNELYKDIHRETKDKQEERLFHTWGYMLPMMKEPMDYPTYKRKAMSRRTGSRRKKSDYSGLIDRVEKIRIRHQSEAGD